MSDEQKKSLTTTVSTAKISTVTGLEELLSVAEKQTINLIPKTITFGTRPELILTARLVFVNTVLKENSFFSKKQNKNIKYLEKSNGDIYLVDSKSKKYALSSRKLKEIADAAGVNTVDLERMSIEHDENGRINKVQYKLIWERLDIDGSLKKGISEGFYSYQAQIDKKKKEDEKDGETDLSYLEKQRGDGEKLAIANCYSRAIRDAIPQMQATFTLDELEKPLLIPSVTKDLSKLIEKYPDIEKALLAKELGLADLIYGNPQTTPPATKAVETKQGNKIYGSSSISKPKDNVEDAQIIDEKNAEKKEEPQQQPKAEDESANPPANCEADKPEIPSEPTADEKIKIAAKEYLDQPDNVRVKKIQELLKQKGRDWSGDKKIEEYSAKRHVAFIETLMKLPDAVQKIEEGK